jgi:NADPH2:quinone reductase
MRAVVVERFGEPGVLAVVEASDPVVGPGQALIDVAVADVLFLDAQLRAGWGREFFGIAPPFVPGDGVAGRVVAVGEGTDPGWVGRRVIARTGGSAGYVGGGYAERAVAPETELVAAPDDLDLTIAAALLHDGPTALGLAESTGIEPGEWVLVVGAAGGMGTLLLQLARAVDAKVIGAARGQAKLDHVRSIGADAAIDYAAPDWVDQAKQAAGGEVTVAFDGVGGAIGTAAFAAVAPGGRFSAHGSASGAFAAIDPGTAAARRVTMRGIEQAQFGSATWRRLAARALTEAAAGRLRPVIGQSFPLERAADAHVAIEARRALGKTLLEVA